MQQSGGTSSAAFLPMASFSCAFKVSFCRWDGSLKMRLLSWAPPETTESRPSSSSFCRSRRTVMCDTFKNCVSSAIETNSRSCSKLRINWRRSAGMILSWGWLLIILIRPLVVSSANARDRLHFLSEILAHLGHKACRPVFFTNYHKFVLTPIHKDSSYR